MNSHLFFFYYNYSNMRNVSHYTLHIYVKHHTDGTLHEYSFSVNDSINWNTHKLLYRSFSENRHHFSLVRSSKTTIMIMNFLEQWESTMTYPTNELNKTVKFARSFHCSVIHRIADDDKDCNVITVWRTCVIALLNYYLFPIHCFILVEWWIFNTVPTLFPRKITI